MDERKYAKRRRRAPDMVSQDYVPPYNTDAEQSVLGAMLLWTDARDTALASVKAEHFYREDHQALFTAISDMTTMSLPVDILSLFEFIRKTRELPKAQEIYIANLFNKVPGPSSIAYHCQIVREKSIRRTMITSALEVMASARDEELEIDEVVAEAQTAFDVEVVAAEDDESMISDLNRENIELAEERGKRGVGVNGMTTGIAILDLITDGMKESDLIIVAARPSMGKTSICTQIGEHVTLTLQKGVYIASLEMNKSQLSSRMMCSRANVELREFESGQLSYGAQAAIDRVDEEFFNAKMMICDKVSMRPSELLRRCRRFQRRHGLGLVIVDYLQLMSSDKREENRTQEISSIAKALKQIARELKVPVIALSQLSRAVERRENKRPMLSDMNESGAIEAAADMAWFLYRESYYAAKTAFLNQEQGDIDARSREEMEIIIGKHRKGKTGMVKVDFIPAYTRFLDPEDTSNVPIPTGF